MSAFFGLLKKDLNLMKFWYGVWLVVLFLIIIGSFSLAKWVSEPSVVVPIFVMLLGFHSFLMPLMVISVLRIEGKTQLWLYNPQSSRKLLLSKISAAMIFQILSQLIVGLYGLVVIKYLKMDGLLGQFDELLTFKVGFFIEIGILFFAVYMSMWAMILWTIYHSLGKYPAIKNFRWLIVIAVLISYNVFESLLIRINLIQKQFSVMSINLNIVPSLDYQEHGWNIMYSETPIPILPIILYTILTIILFLIASRLLDRKVEV